jgi:aspartate oxidase
MGIVTHNCDILIVGGGLAGLSAALAAVKSDKRIVIADLGGGASSEVMGFCAPLAPDDSAEIFAADTLRAGAGENDPALVNRLCADAVKMVRNLESLGIEFDHKQDGSYDLLHPVGSSFPRVVHHQTTTGKVVMEKYRELLQSCANCEFHQVRIVKLFTNNGQIAGAFGFEHGEPIIYNTPAVILTTGGAAGLYSFSSWTKILQGSGYALALDAGAELTGMNRVQFEPCVAVYPEKLYSFPIITTLLYEGARLLDRNNQPVVTEPLPKRELALRITSAIAAGNGCEHGGIWFDFAQVDETTFLHKYPQYYHKLRPFVEDFHHLRIEVKPAAHTTLGGIKITPDGATAVPGLFAAGEAAGGIHGRDRIGGNAGLEILVFGHAAGHTASTYPTSTDDVSKVAMDFIAGLRSGTGNRDIFILRLGEILDCYCGTLRTDKRLAEGQWQLNELAAGLADNPPRTLEDNLRCHQSITVAEQLMRIHL